ncbi:MAG: CBS domain-containing protein [Candidatus Bathyarchaeota archaeon]|nr:MAG: CBS domain-containing protein [Candidatus Bathyarchaeota archaeon]
MIIEKIMVKNVITMEKDVSANDAVEIMNKNRIGCLVVVDQDRVVGILTERDVLERIVGKCRDPKETRVSDIMTKQVIVGKPDMQLAEASKLLLEKKVKKLPIVDGNRLVGLVTLTDIVRVATLDNQTLKLIESRAQFLKAFISDFCARDENFGRIH